MKYKISSIVFALALILGLGRDAQAYVSVIECSVNMTIPSCDMEVEPTYATIYGFSTYNGVECEDMARQHCGSHVDCPNGNSGYTTQITCGSTNWGW